MIRLSINVLTAIQGALHKSIKYSVYDEETLWSINNSQIDTAWIIETTQRCRWIECDNTSFNLTERGYDLFSADHTPNEYVLRDMLYDYIFYCCPVWSYKIPTGRNEALFIMTKDERACFHEAGLLSENPDKEIVKTVQEGLKAKGGYCPCKVGKHEDIKCMCKEFREQAEEGLCHCGLYQKVKIDSK